MNNRILAEAQRVRHPRLREQLQRWLPPGTELGKFVPLLDAIDQALQDADQQSEQMQTLLEQTKQALIGRNQDLKKQLSLLHTTLNSTRDGILVLDEQEQLVTCNDVFIEMFKARRDPMEEDTKGYLSVRLQRAIRNYDEFERMMGHTRRYPDKPSYCLLEFHDGRYFDCSSKPRYEEGHLIGRVWSLSDITELKLSEQQALHQSYHDSLTGLPNRNLFFERLSHAIETGKGAKNELAVLFMDLDGFKYVNDTLGHDAGDELLRQAAKRLQRVLNEGTPGSVYADLKRGQRDSTLARYGGDEFILLLENLRSSFEATLVADAVRKVMLEPFRLQEQEIHITTSIGIALCPNDSDTPETLIRKADMAMYHAKNQGRNNYQFFAEELEKLSSYRLKLRNNLKNALANNEFRLVYQPKIDLVSRRITGCEALIRWHRTNGEIIPPLDFIPVAEENGMIIEISEWVFATACEQMRQWVDLGLTDFSVAINVSALHFQQGNVVQSVEGAIRKAGIKPQHIELEITESIIMENVEKTIGILQRLRERGIRTAIDDFGTGYSSLNYLKQLPFDLLKIDKSFVDDMILSERSMALVRTIIDLAHHLGLKVVAEGVETDKMAQTLLRHTCDFAQGYYFSRPVDADTLTAMLGLEEAPP